MQCRQVAEPRFAERRRYDSYATPNFWHAGVPSWAPAGWHGYHAWAMNAHGAWACPIPLVDGKCSHPYAYPWHSGMPYHHNNQPFYPGYDPATPPAHVNVDGLVNGESGAGGSDGDSTSDGDDATTSDTAPPPSSSP